MPLASNQMAFFVPDRLGKHVAGQVIADECIASLGHASEAALGMAGPVDRLLILEDDRQRDFRQGLDRTRRRILVSPRIGVGKNEARHG